MKIGIITFHCSFNYGSVLQAYALQRTLTELGFDSKIIDFISNDFDQYRIFPLNHPRLLLQNLLRLHGLMKRRHRFHKFQSEYLMLTGSSYSSSTDLTPLVDKFDIFVCGSDQIWNLDCTRGVVGPYFLSFAGDKRRVAYAPSLAHTSFKPEFFDKKKVSELLSKFDYLSVREEETVPVFQPLVDKKIEVVLDPTLLLDASAYTDMVGKRIQEAPYIFVYLLRDCPELVESAIAMADLSGMTGYYVSESRLPIPNSRNLFGIGPEEFVSLIAHANVVLANSFHSTVFSILFHRSFRVFATDGSASRMRDLLAKLGIPERCSDKVDSSLITDVDWNGVERRLGELRKGSCDYLRRALS